MKLGEAGSVMDKVVMVGVFDFVNFHVCKALLDKGIEVRGVQIETEDESDILIEKRLEIGRNANFTEVSIGDILIDSYENETIVLSVYDLYMRYKEEYLLNEDMLFNLISKNKWEQIVILVPSQMLTNEFESKAEIVIDDFINRAESHKQDIHLLYLPTIFGAWQPDTFMFQNSILTDMNRGKPFRGLREETSDAIFVEDTVHAIIEIIENKLPGRYLLQSGKSNQWNLCASFLRINEQGSTERKAEANEDKITIFTVKNTVSIAEGLTKQIDHAHRINSE
jgi:nucleoside-diphosphate-sugar epimerase